jgi:hypothetical protein
MVRSFTALLIFSLLGASVIALPGFAPQVEAREGVALAKADRLDLRTAVKCSDGIWPDLPTACLQSAGAKVVEARLVTARR